MTSAENVVVMEADVPQGMTLLGWNVQHAFDDRRGTWSRFVYGDLAGARLHYAGIPGTYKIRPVFAPTDEEDIR